jgi:Cu(I)/Ag(I) efflux system membrane fusion protein
MFATGTVNANLDQYANQLVIPRSAVLWTGKRSVVYVKKPGDEPVFTIREIGLGPMLGNSYVVTDGLQEGEEIVTEGAFSVDAAAQLEGKPSMMNQEGGMKSTGHDHGAMTSEKSMSSDASHAQFNVAGNCEMCEERIETAAQSVTGVISADWNVENKIMKVQFNEGKTNTDEIQKAVAKVGHDTEKFKAPDDVYNELPECCLYTRK